MSDYFYSLEMLITGGDADAWWEVMYCLAEENNT
jgi:hypothetical protein